MTDCHYSCVLDELRLQNVTEDVADAIDAETFAEKRECLSIFHAYNSPLIEMVKGSCHLFRVLEARARAFWMPHGKSKGKLTQVRDLQRPNCFEIVWRSFVATSCLDEAEREAEKVDDGLTSF